ncbi:hypothetical protein PRZ48_012623 [Zasmidium cellare]|uniref:G-patch domain-containing protein n=1 Tax=Zasmidium cellare TaxID=395010 RepID=A0ABR0E5Y2_ZASCE|nr:hypothetical protein PRZ48_012623 [Zasmidium cellare]
MAEPPKKRGLTLYGDLITPETRAEVEARDAKALADEKKKQKDASLMFKPSNLGKKNNPKPAQKPKPKPPTHKFSSSTSTGTAPTATNTSDASSQQPSSDAPQPTQKRGYNDWLANEEEEQEQGFYDRRPRWQSKKQKKHQQQVQEQWSFDDNYDPSTPTQYGQYAGTDYWRQMNDAWKTRLGSARAQHQAWWQAQAEAHQQAQAASRGGFRGGYPNAAGRGYHQNAGGHGNYHGMRGRGKYPNGRGRGDHYNMRGRGDRYNMRGRGDYASMRGRGDYPTMGSRQPPNMQFAPPQSFEPPQSFDPPTGPRSRPGSRGPSSGRNSGFGNRNDHNAGPFLPPADVNKDESADDAYARRLAMSAQHQPPTASAPMPQANPPPSRAPLSAEDQAKKDKAAEQIAAIKAKLAAKANSASPAAPAQNWAAVPPPPSSSPPADAPPPPPPATKQHVGVISAAPTYNPEYLAQKARQERQQSYGHDGKPPSDAADDDDKPHSNAPGKAGFAQRMMKKMGHEEGKGLGASGEGITAALSVKADKRKKKPDAQGGGYVTPAATGKIVGGNQAKKADDHEGGPHGKMSAVVKFEGMLRGMDIDKAIQDDGILQEIGDEMAEFGKVERLKIWRNYEGGNDEVFIKFTSQLSALRAINAMHGAEFEGNIIQASYWDDEKFDANVYA